MVQSSGWEIYDFIYAVWTFQVLKQIWNPHKRETKDEFRRPDHTGSFPRELLLDVLFKLQNTELNARLWSLPYDYHILNCNLASLRRQNDVVTTSFWCVDVVTTSIQRCSNIFHFNSLFLYHINEKKVYTLKKNLV